MSQKPLIAGVGMIPFTKPGMGESYYEMGARAARLAIEDAGLDYAAIEQAYVGYVYGDSTSGQSALYEVGITGIPIINVNNNCSSGSTALFLARQAVESGATDVALALGFEQMVPGALGMHFQDRKPTMARCYDVAEQSEGEQGDTALMHFWFGGAGKAHMSKHGTSQRTFAKIAEKARRHAADNPHALFRDPLSAEEILASKPLYGPLTRYQACAPTCGAAAAVVVSGAYARKKGLTGLVEIAGQALTTDTAESFQDMIGMIGFGMTREAARQVYEQAGVGPEDIQVVELHDCFTVAEAVFSEALGLCPEGGIEQLVANGDNSYGGKYVVNPSGGLLSKGHPLGATGLAQCYELVNQLRGTTGRRQVEGVRNALQHNAGLGGAAVVTLYRNAGS
jgi:acetyl-CoA acetyltransferase